MNNKTINYFLLGLLAISCTDDQELHPLIGSWVNTSNTVEILATSSIEQIALDVYNPFSISLPSLQSEPLEFRYIFAGRETDEIGYGVWLFADDLDLIFIDSSGYKRAIYHPSASSLSFNSTIAEFSYNSDEATIAIDTIIFVSENEDTLTILDTDINLPYLEVNAGDNAVIAHFDSLYSSSWTGGELSFYDDHTYQLIPANLLIDSVEVGSWVATDDILEISDADTTIEYLYNIENNQLFLTIQDELGDELINSEFEDMYLLLPGSISNIHPVGYSIFGKK